MYLQTFLMCSSAAFGYFDDDDDDEAVTVLIVFDYCEANSLLWFCDPHSGDLQSHYVFLSCF